MRVQYRCALHAQQCGERRVQRHVREVVSARGAPAAQHVAQLQAVARRRQRLRQQAHQLQRLSHTTYNERHHLGAHTSPTVGLQHSPQSISHHMQKCSFNVSHLRTLPHRVLRYFVYLDDIVCNVYDLKSSILLLSTIFQRSRD